MNGESSSPAELPAEIAAFYAAGLERDRLAAGAGALEFARTWAIVERYLPPPPAQIVDVGGGAGRYALPLARLGHVVHVLDPVPLHVDQACAASDAQPDAQLASASLGDARTLPLPNASADLLLLLGPLYHLTERDDRVQALSEAARVVRAGGVVLAAAISRFASTLDGLRAGYLEDPTFAGVATEDRESGQHRNPTANPAYFTTAYFHRPEELAEELDAAGLTHETTLAVEGVAWLLPDLDARLSNDSQRAVLLGALAALEAEPALLGASAHLLAVGRRPGL